MNTKKSLSWGFTKISSTVKRGKGVQGGGGCLFTSLRSKESSILHNSVKIWVFFCETLALVLFYFFQMLQRKTLFKVFSSFSCIFSFFGIIFQLELPTSAWGKRDCSKYLRKGWGVGQEGRVGYLKMALGKGQNGFSVRKQQLEKNCL